jgi:hypothetical protein
MEVSDLDFIPDKEFHPLFDRTSRVVDFEGCGTARDINERLNQAIKEVKYECGTGPLAPLRARRQISNLKRLIFAGFARRAIDEAIAKPQGKIALTLKYGREGAKGILQERHRRLRSKRAIV